MTVQQERTPVMVDPVDRGDCPPWCFKHVTNGTKDSELWHVGRCSDGEPPMAVIVVQVDPPAYVCRWDEEDSTWIGVVAPGQPKEFSLHDLTPEQAYALADLVGSLGDERLAASLLNAVELVKPELLR